MMKSGVCSKSQALLSPKTLHLFVCALDNFVELIHRGLEKLSIEMELINHHRVVVNLNIKKGNCTNKNFITHPLKNYFIWSIIYNCGPTR